MKLEINLHTNSKFIAGYVEITYSIWFTWKCLRSDQNHSSKWFYRRLVYTWWRRTDKKKYENHSLQKWIFDLVCVLHVVVNCENIWRFSFKTFFILCFMEGHMRLIFPSFFVQIFVIAYYLCKLGFYDSNHWLVYTQ